MLRGNAILGQSGGPTSVINASLCGIIQACLQQEAIGKTLGMRFGIDGFMRDEVLDLGREPAAVIEGLRTTPSSALGSCRHKLKDADFPKVLEMLKKHDIRYYFLIGGNDTMDTIHRVEKYCRQQGYELIGVGVPKTVDNDLCGTDHTPGFGSAARYVALSVQQAGLLARDMQRVDQYVIFQTVGRSAGWLPAAAALAKRSEDDAPHIILLPERAFDREKFLAAVRRCHDRYGWCSIVCGEGVCYADGTPISASQTKDKFANVEFGAMGGTSAAMMLHRMIREEFDWRGEFQVCESLQMCAADRTCPGDVEEAYACGRRAVELAVAGTSGVMVSIVRESTDPYRWSLGTAPLAEVALGAKPMPDEFINAEGLSVTQACVDYLKPLVGPLPHYVRLGNVS
ncbi:MAG: 6-phosphofructokinase [Planctomycetaceae bacterium]|nr:6-phosphofructokinase [Planctomycetaceae bacterium]